MEDFTIQGTYTLPSGGKLYGSKGINPEITLRSMTTNDEMKRLNHSDKPYAIMSEVIDDCMITKCPISSYDMCLADYQFLLHRLRAVTYGSEYKIQSTCPYCGTSSVSVIDLDSLIVKPLDEELYNKYLEFDLPKTGKHIKLRMQTPRMLDGISMRSKEQKKRTPDMVGDPAFLFTLEALIAEIDGQKPEPTDLPLFVRTLPMMDTNYIVRYSQKLSDCFGIDSNITLSCGACGLEHDATFRTTPEFFGPTIDI